MKEIYEIRKILLDMQQKLQKQHMSAELSPPIHKAKNAAISIICHIRHEDRMSNLFLY